jgi:phasin family protein
MMVQVNEQVAALGKSQLETALKLAEIAAQGVEKLAAVQFTAAKAAFADGVKTTQLMSSVKDPSEFSALGTSLAQPALEKAQAYVKSVYEVAATTQAEISTLLEQQAGEFNKTVVVALDNVLKSAPPGSESAVAAAKSVIQFANAAYDSMLKATKQMTAIAETNVANIAAQTTTTRKKAA